MSSKVRIAQRVVLDSGAEEGASWKSTESTGSVPFYLSSK